MAGTLSVQKTQGLASSATPTVVEVSSGHELHTNTLKGTTTAGSITVQGENTATTNLQQGLAKSWVNFDQENSNVLRDSLNVSGVTDHTTGRYSVSYSNNMNSIYYSSVGNASSRGASTATYNFCMIDDYQTTQTSSATRYASTNYSSGNFHDMRTCNPSIFGDLA